MPTTLVGLLIFVSFLTPGLLHYVQRRVLAPQRALSPLVETATVASVSLAANAVVLVLFGLARLAFPEHTPDVGQLLRNGTDYLIPRAPYVLAWGGALLALSCFLAVVAARWSWLRSSVTDLFAPVIIDASAWYQVFEERPDDAPDAQIYVGCDMKDGSYLSGRLSWYSTEIAETADRDLVLAPPLLRRKEGVDDTLEDFERVIVSLREIRTIYVTWLRQPEEPLHA